MAKYICLLRGINVGGKNVIKMAELREALPEIGWSDAETYIQSGNIVFNAKAADAKPVKVAGLIKDEWGYDVSAMIVTSRRWLQLVANDPFERLEKKFVHLTLLGAKPKKEFRDAVLRTDIGDDLCELEGDCLYLYCPNGYSKTKLTNSFLERKLKTSATTRNWNTVLKLLRMSN